MLKQPNFFYCQPYTLPKDAPAKFYPSTTFGLNLLPTEGGGGGLFGPRHQTSSHNSVTLSPRVFKISDFSFMPFGHIVPKVQVNRSARVVAAVISSKKRS